MADRLLSLLLSSFIYFVLFRSVGVFHFLPFSISTNDYDDELKGCRATILQPLVKIVESQLDATAATNWLTHNGQLTVNKIQSFARSSFFICIHLHSTHSYLRHFENRFSLWNIFLYQNIQFRENWRQQSFLCEMSFTSMVIWNRKNVSTALVRFVHRLERKTKNSQICWSKVFIISNWFSLCVCRIKWM